MATFLFDKIIFGPICSRRLGTSLGVNLLPTATKVCNFDCIYCECGRTAPARGLGALPTREQVARELAHVLADFRQRTQPLDTITFAGNGEPTLHPEFAAIIDDTLALRDRQVPGCKVSVLSNATAVGQRAVFEALKRVDQPILKLDAGTEETFQRLNQPLGACSLAQIAEALEAFAGNVFIQSLFVRSKRGPVRVDNTTDVEVEHWVRLLHSIRPRLVMIYPIDRDTAVSGLEKVPGAELERIAERVRQAGIRAEVF